MINSKFYRLGALSAAALFGLAVSVGPMSAAGDPEPSPPKSDVKTKKGKDDTKKKSEQEFIDGYRKAYALVQDGQYAAAFAAFKALHHDEHPDVANYLGYTSRKLGNYELAKVWYERALAADPNHTRTWQYYGMWQIEQGNLLKAEDFLQKIHAICGNTTCSDYVKLKEAIDGNISY